MCEEGWLAVGDECTQGTGLPRPRSPPSGDQPLLLSIGTAQHSLRHNAQGISTELSVLHMWIDHLASRKLSRIHLASVGLTLPILRLGGLAKWL